MAATLLKYLCQFFCCVLLLLFMVQCGEPKSKIPISFYYWRTFFQLSDLEKSTLEQNQVNTLYVRFFDIDIKDTALGPIPVGVLEGLDSLKGGIKIVPVVFITNRTFLKTNQIDIKQLAEKTISKINSIYEGYTEVQMDCDWTEKTRDNYFLFLNEIRKQIENKKVLLSATIRLHQVKYKEVTGVPPVNRGMLMFYNMGDVGNPNEKNSIFNKEKADLYVNYLNAYLLPLDVALPVFSWQAHFRDGRILNLFNKKNLNDLNGTDFKEAGTNKFVATRDMVASGKFIREGDLLKVEEIKKEDLISAAELLKKNLGNDDRRLVFYDLDDYNLNCYEKTIYQTIADCLN